MPKAINASSRKARRYDRLASWIITLGGIAVIGSVVAILAMIVGVTLPLFQKPRADLLRSFALPETIRSNDLVGLSVEAAIKGSDVTLSAWTKDGSVSFVDARTGKVLRKQLATPSAKASTATLQHVEPIDGQKYWLLWSNGDASLVEATFGTSPGVRVLATVAAFKEESEPTRIFVRRSDSGAITRAALLANGDISIHRQVKGEGLLDEDETKTHHHVVREDCGREITAMTMDREGHTLYAGTSSGMLGRWKLDSEGKVEQREIVRASSDRRAITALALALGDVSLVVGDARGGLATWCLVNADGTRKLRQIHVLKGHQGAVATILPSGRNKTLLSLDDKGVVHLDYLTSERHLISVASPSAEKGNAAVHVAYNPRGDALALTDAAGKLNVWRVAVGSPEVSWTTLFGKVFYESYNSPAYVWQTTGGEDFEPKYSLVPLLFGTLKGTFYAMFFAGPLALFGAAYVSYFTTPWFRKIIKPVVEIMATLPSVVIGFLIALWLAPIIERWILAVFVSLVTVPIAFVCFMLFWQYVRRWDWAKRVENGYEFLVLPVVLAAGIAIAVLTAEYIERPIEKNVANRPVAAAKEAVEGRLFHGNFRQWLFETLGIQYDQRNNIIIAFGLGFTVIPIIFSIAEDSLSNVPYSMTAASMALGASRWQTFWRVILPSASPGIFAAMMIGFGRAVGETMIVLMATGNTPILDWSPLNGMRTLSANIAVEIPEAPVGGTLYRVLFLCAVLLFLMTFLVNTTAELVRQHLRKRYGRF